MSFPIYQYYNPIHTEILCVWERIQNGDFNIKAKDIRHTVRTFGYVFEEAEKVSLSGERLESLKISPADRKLLKAGIPVTSELGETIFLHQVTSEVTPGRKIGNLQDIEPFANYS